jgi:hypothetical protein
MKPLLILAAASALAAGAARAETAATFVPTLPIGPYSQAAWTDPAAPGSGLLFEIVPGAAPTLFGTLFTYTDSGKDTWLVAQGPYEPASDETRIATGELGRASAPLVQGRGGSCLKCAYSAPAFDASPLGQVDFVFKSATQIEMRLFGVAQPRTLIPLDLVVWKALPDALAGTWRGSARFLLSEAGGTREQVDSCTMTFTRSHGPSPDDTYQRLFRDVRRVPAPGSTFLHATAPARCGFHDGPDMWLTVDPATGALVELRIQEVGPCSPACPIGFDVTENPAAVFYLVAPNRLVARWDANRTGETAVLGELELKRVP